MHPGSGDTVLVRHCVTTSDGQELESSFEPKKPLRFTIDSNRVIRGLNDALKTMEVGDTQRITIPAAQAHGVYSPTKIRHVAKTAFYQGAQIGQTMTFQGDLGEPVSARIIDETEDAFIMDMNHPLAGKDLSIEVKLLEILESSECAPFI